MTMTLEQAIDRKHVVVRLSNAMEELSKVKLPFYSGITADETRMIEKMWAELYAIRRRIEMELVSAVNEVSEDE